MSWWRRWVVLVPGDVTWVERRTRELLEEQDDGREHPFMVIPGTGRYQAIVEKDRDEFGPEYLLGELLSLECEEPVYTIEGVEEYPYIARFLKGQEEYAGDQEPDDLVRSLGCENKWTVEPPLEPWGKTARRVALVQGVSMAKMCKALEKEAGRPLPAGYYRIEETPLGILLTDGTGPLVFAQNYLAERFPRATVYSVTASPELDFFVVLVMQGDKTLKFVPSPQEDSTFPAIHEIMGEREPERVLAALGIPKEWFKL
jgi:hypothetical protein